MGECAFSGVFGEDAELGFVGGNVEAPRAEPLRDLVDRGLKVQDGTRSFAAVSARKSTVSSLGDDLSKIL